VRLGFYLFENFRKNKKSHEIIFREKKTLRKTFLIFCPTKSRFTQRDHENRIFFPQTRADVREIARTCFPATAFPYTIMAPIPALRAEAYPLTIA